MWLPLALFTALATGTTDALSKKALLESKSNLVALARPLWASVFLLPLIFFCPPPHNPGEFWKALALALPFEVSAALAANKSIKSAPLSLSIPYLAFTPVFLLLGGWIFLGEMPSPRGIAGVLCVTGGAFLLQSESWKWPSVEKGALLMLLVALLYAVTTIFCKKALLASSPLTFSCIYYPCTALCLLPFQGRGFSWVKELGRQKKIFSFMGFLDAVTIVVQFTALQQAKVAYMISIKRLSLLVSVFYGWRFFGENPGVGRLIGAGLMFAGAVLIGFS